MSLSQRLLQLRKEKGLSQMELAEEMGVSRQAVSRWEVGAVVPSSENLVHLSRLYGVSVDYLLNEKTNEACNQKVKEKIETHAREEENHHQAKGAMRWMIIVLVLFAAMMIYMVIPKTGKEELSIQEMTGEVVELDPENQFDIDW